MDPRGRVRWRTYREARDVLTDDAPATAIDVPIGLPEAGPRACDLHARRVLARRGSTVFPAPPRRVLSARTYAEACAAARSADGRAISRQTWLIVPRISDVDTVLTPTRQARIVEVHPELTFATLAGRPLPSKRRAEGPKARLAALTGWLTDPATILSAAPPQARPDDALDALAAAWSAWRWLHGEARVLPCDNPPRDGPRLAHGDRRVTASAPPDPPAAGILRPTALPGVSRRSACGYGCA